MFKRGKRGAITAASLLLLLTIGHAHFDLYIFSVPASSPATPPSTQNKELESIIKSIEARYGRMRGLAADFEQTYSGAGVRTRRERGRLFLQRPRRMRWEYDPKPGKLFIVNGREVWFYVPSDREATHADAGSISDARFPFLFLLGNTNLRRFFRSILLVEAAGGAAASDTRTLRLMTRERVAGLREIILEVYADGSVSRIKIIDDAGAVSDVLLTNVRENFIAPAAAFEFRPPPGVNVRQVK